MNPLQKQFDLEMCQLIYYDFNLNEELGNYFERIKFVDVGTNYNTIGIIGPQSTGKSTLLNMLFDTNFAVMNSSTGRGQTTKGVWVAGHKEHKVMIIDCEGTDSKNRSEDDRGKFEHSSSLFALSMSDVLIINMWTNDVGRYTASNYGVLKIVFEMNLKLFQQECAKKILIILRDFDPKRNQRDKIESMILADIHKIWDEIKKPDQYKNSLPEKFFNFEFVTLSHKIYLPKKFEEEVLELRKRLNSSNEKYLFQHLNNIKSIPVDGLKQYVSQIWKDILNEKELDIPSQKEMLATYRCSEIKSNTLAEFEKEFNELHLQSAKNDINDFKQLGEILFSKIMAVYVKTASNYDETIYKAMGKQLEDAVLQKLLMCFINQAKRLIPIIQKLMRNDLHINLKKAEKSYADIAKGLRTVYFKLLLTRLKEKQVFEKWSISEQEYNHIFDEIIDNQKKKLFEEKKIEITKALKKEIEEIFLNCLENHSRNFWEEFNENYISLFFMKVEPLRVYLKDYYAATDDEIIEFTKGVETDLYNSIKKNCLKKVKDISTIMIDLFKKKFWYEKDEMRNWNKYTEEEIDTLFKKNRNEYIELFDELKTLKVIQNPLDLVRINETFKSEEEIIKERVKETLHNPSDYEVLLKQNEVLAIKKKFEVGLSTILEDAKRRKEGLFASNIPIWFYCLLAFFGYDDLWRLIKSKYIIPVLMIITALFFVYKFDKEHKMKNVYFDLEVKCLKLKKKIFNFFKTKFNF